MRSAANVSNEPKAAIHQALIDAEQFPRASSANFSAHFLDPGNGNRYDIGVMTSVS